MRIFFVNRFFFPDHSATSQILSDLASFLAARGHQVTVITSRQRYDAPDALLPTEDDWGGIRVSRVWTSRFGRGFLPGRALDYLTFYLSAAWRLLRLVQPGDLVVAKTDPPLISLVAAWVCGVRGARLVNWLQDLFPEVASALNVSLAQGPAGRVLARLRDRSLHRAAMNVAIGEGMRRRLLKLGMDAERVRVIHNWADEQRIRPLAPAQNPLRREWGLADTFVVGYSGNLGRAHEYQTLLAAARVLRDQDDILFLLIGGGASMDALRAEARAQGIENLRFQPYQPRERLAESLAVPDVHLVVLRPAMEGLIVPSKLYGILAAGRPTLFVGSRDGEVARLLAAGDAGLSVSVGDGKGLAEAILKLRGDVALRERLGRNARRLCEERFARQAALQRWEQVLAEAAG